MFGFKGTKIILNNIFMSQTIIFFSVSQKVMLNFMFIFLATHIRI